MIDLISFSMVWFVKLRRKYKKVNPPIADKMMHAFALAESLSNSNLEFVLKGGTGLILLLPNAHRFSIDIDIIMSTGRKKIENILKQICQEQIFIHFTLDKKRSYQPGIPKAHYKIYYNSEVTNDEEYVLLDILNSKNIYPACHDKEITSEWIKTTEPRTFVTIPSIESMLGDKLTAFAPHTTGILYGKGKELEIAKQLFDIGILFDLVQNISVVQNSFSNIVQLDIQYRNLTIGMNEVLNDIINTAFLIASRGNKLSADGQTKFREIIRGIQSLNEFLINTRFTLDDAIVASAKAAYLAAKILTNDNSVIGHFTDQNSTDLLIDHPEYNHLNKLKKIPGGSLFYWKHTIDLITNTCKLFNI